MSNERLFKEALWLRPWRFKTPSLYCRLINQASVAFQNTGCDRFERLGRECKHLTAYIPYSCTGVIVWRCCSKSESFPTALAYECLVRRTVGLTVAKRPKDPRVGPFLKGHSAVTKLRHKCGHIKQEFLYSSSKN